MNRLVPPTTPSINTTDGVTLEELNKSRPVNQMSMDKYRTLSQKQRDGLSGNSIDFQTAMDPVPPLLRPIWKDLTNEQKIAFAGDPNSQNNLRITQYPSNEKIAENEAKHADKRAEMNPQQKPVEALKPDAARLASLTKEYGDALYSKFRGTDPNAPETELYKSLKNATDPATVKIRELLYGKIDGGQDTDTGLYDVFRNGKDDADTVMKRLAKVPGSTVEEKLQYLEEAIEQVKQYKVTFGKPKAKVPQESVREATASVDSSKVVPTNAAVQEKSPTEASKATFDPLNTDDIVKRLKAGEVLPISSAEDLKVVLNGLKSAGQTDWYEYVQRQAEARLGKQGK